jgi:NADH dehydrogenase ubiquinone Fe-S protein 4
MSFATKEEAIAFATRNGIAFRLEEPQPTKLRPKSYAENFKFGRPDLWTH